MMVKELNRTLTEIEPGVWRLVAPNASPLTGPGTNTYLVGQKRMVIIDPGPDDDAYGREILTALERLGGTARAVIATHAHADHDAGAPALAQRLNVPLLRQGQPLAHGDALTGSEVGLVVHHTPGHAPDHLCLWLPAQRLLIGGDLVKGDDTVLIIPPDGNMADYLASLRAMKALEPVAILPGHGPVIKDAPRRLQAYIDHRLAREQQVLHCWAQGYTTAQAIAARIYADRPDVLNIATLQVEAHLAKLRAEGRVAIGD